MRPGDKEIEIIQIEVAGHYRFNAFKLATPVRSEEMIRPRFIAMYLCRIMTRASLQQIAHAFGKKDHETVANACRGASRRMQTCQAFHRDLEIIRVRAREKINALSL